MHYRYFIPYTLFLVMVLSPNIFAGNISVPAQYSTIQSAIDAANAGDTILVTDKGIYHEDLAINKRLGLVSSPIGATIDGQITTSNSPSDLYIRGFNITPAATGKYGIRITDSAKARLYSCIVSANLGGVSITGAAPTFLASDTNFVQCGANGVCVNNSLGTAVTLSKCKFINNGGNGFWGHTAIISVQDSIFDRNLTGIRVEGGSLQMDRCKFMNGPVTPSEDDNDVNTRYQGYIIINGESLASYSNNIFNCLLIGSRNPVRLFGMSAFDIRHCTIVDPCNVMNSAFRCYANSEAALYCNVRNSIIDGADYGITSHGTGAMRFEGTIYNLWNCSVNTFNGAGTDSGALSSILNRSPGFLNPEVGDYHLTDTSDCIGTGTPNITTSTDIEGKPHSMPINSYPDLGCYEEQSTLLKLKTPETVMLITLEGHDMYDNTDKLLQSLVSSCQGHLNKTGPRVYVIWAKSYFNNTDCGYTWINYDIKKFNLQTQYVGLPQLLSEASKVVNQYILFDDAQYVNKIGGAIVTMAGAENLILVGPNEEALVQKFGFTRKYDRRTTWDNASYTDIYSSIWETYRPQVSTKRLSVFDGIDPAGMDWFINEKMMCLNLSSNANTYPDECALLSSIYSSYAYGSWVVTATVEPPRDGNPSVLTAKYGLAYLYPGGKNISFHKWMVLNNLPKIRPMAGIPPINPNKTYLSLSLSDGDALFIHLGGSMGKYKTSRQLTVPIGWAMTPALLYCAPDVYSYYIENAREGDVFVSAWGIGYAGPHLMPEDGLRAYLRESLYWVKKGNFQVANCLEDVDITNPSDTGITPISKINTIFEEFGSQIWGVTSGYGGIPYGSYYEGPEYQSTTNDHIWLNNRLFPYTGAGYDADEELLSMKNTIESISAAQKKPNEPLFLPGWPIIYPKDLPQKFETLKNVLDPNKFEIVRLDQLLAMKQKWNNPDHAVVQPSSAQWQTIPHMISCNSINMIAAVPVYPPNPEYYFVCTNGSGHDSGWQDSPMYTDSNLPSDSNASYKTIFREKTARWNISGYSGTNSAVSSIAGDIDGDEMVGFSDFAKFASYWLNEVGPYGIGDLDGDGYTGWKDLHIFVSNWLQKSDTNINLQLADFDNYLADGWFFGCGAPTYYDDGGNASMVSQSSTVFFEGSGSVRFAYTTFGEYNPAQPWNNRIRKVFNLPIDMSFANTALSIKVKGTQNEHARLSAIYLVDINGNAAYLQLHSSAPDVWIELVAPIADFIPWDASLDYSKISIVDLMTSCYPDGAPTFDVYLDDLRLVSEN